jgi:glycosyltransferase involved in cell wall biosynthesis
MNRQRSLAFFLPALAGGGAEHSFVALANAFAAAGWRVDMVAANAVGPCRQHIDSNVNIVDFQRGRVSSCVFHLAAFLARRKPEFIVSGIAHANVTCVAAAYIAGYKGRVVVSERNTISASRYSWGWRGRLLHACIAHAYRRASAVITVSEGVAADLVSSYSIDRKRIFVAVNPAVPDNIEALASAGNVHPWLHPGQASVPLVVSAGRLTDAKDFPTLIRAFGLVSRARPCRLLILGAGERREMLIRLVEAEGLSDRVCLMGYVENPYPYFRAAKVFALTSKYEGLPGVLIQALACGTTVVASDCKSGPSEILEGGRWGVLFPVGDQIALARALEGVLSGRIAIDGRDRAKAFSVAAAYRRYADILLYAAESDSPLLAHSRATGH